MPGIMPMKVIKVGSASQSRIAQACDRCRSKKIRCDGIRPTCSQCAAVGFECRTSDKLSRRAFPRGYTETLEERVRNLEAEARELKDLLDQRDEKIDVLARLHPSSAACLAAGAPTTTMTMMMTTTAGEATATAPVAAGVGATLTANTALASTTTTTAAAAEAAVSEPAAGRRTSRATDVVHVRGAPRLDEPDGLLVGTAPVHMLFDAFRTRLRQLGLSSSKVDVEILKLPERRRLSVSSPSGGRSSAAPSQSSAPPRMVSDELINIYFQEWAPLFPVLHRPSLLASYEAYCADPESMRDRYCRAQLHLVFKIAARSRETESRAGFGVCERPWYDGLDNSGLDRSLANLQCLVLAGKYSILSGDQDRLQHYRGRAVALAHRLGLHRSQRSLSLDSLALETRKRVFWCLYVLDCLAAATLGVPRLLKDCEIQTEIPADTDDEYVTDHGFEAPPPGQSTRLSAALALFQGARILGSALDRLYPVAAASYKFTAQDQGAVEDDLRNWANNLAPQLKLQFIRGKPSTDWVNSRALLLTLMHQYTHLLIALPALVSNAGSGSSFQPLSSSIHSVADSATRILQIIQLLEERSMSFSFAMHKGDLLFLAGLGILFQALDLDHKGKLIKDSERWTASVLLMLERDEKPAAQVFRQAAHLVLPSALSSPAISGGDEARPSSVAPPGKPRSAHRRLQSLATRIQHTTSRVRSGSKWRDDTRPDSTRHSMTNGASPAPAPGPAPPLYYHVQSSPVVPQLNQTQFVQTMAPPQRTRSHLDAPNLDYLSFSTEPLTSNLELTAKLEPRGGGGGGGSCFGEWQPFTSSFEHGPPMGAAPFHDPHATPASLSPDPSSAAGAHGHPQAAARMGQPVADIWRRPSLQSIAPHPALSYSEEGVTTTAADLSNGDMRSGVHDDPFRGMMLPTSSMGGDSNPYSYEPYDPSHRPGFGP